MSQDLTDFFDHNYSPGRVGLIGASDVVGTLIRGAQSGITPDGKPSKWSHSFILGEKRNDGRSDGSIYIYESDLSVSVTDWQVKNGVMESRLVKWCRDDIDYACVLGSDLDESARDKLLSKALHYAYDEQHLRYPVGELFGSLWAILTRTLSKKNIFDMKYAVQCATFVRMCYQHIGKDPLGTDIDPSQSTPEALHASASFTYREEWQR